MAATKLTKQPRVWQRMLSGRRLDLLDPSPLDVELEDIAHGLARVARWNGQTNGEYIFSVAQHSLLVECIVSLLAPESIRPTRLAALMHDAPEYVIGDVISPFKAVIGDEYRTVEQRLMHVIHLHFKLPAKPARPVSRLIKQADHQAAFFEATHLAGFSRDEAEKFFGKPVIGTSNISDLLVPWPARQAQERFLDKARELLQGHVNDSVSP